MQEHDLDFFTNNFKLVIITRPGCPWCTMLKNKTLPTLHELGLSLFIGQGEKLETFFEVVAWPAIVYTDQTGQKLYKEEGYVPPTRVIEVLSKLANGEDPDESTESIQEQDPVPLEGETPPFRLDDPWADELPE